MVVNIDSYRITDNKCIIETKKWFQDYYQPIVVRKIPAKKTYIGCSETKQCRFCGKTEPEVTFKQETHAIPVCLGNHTLISLEECDGCNAIFGKYEVDLSNYFPLARFIYGVKGRKGTITLQRSHNDRAAYITPIKTFLKKYEDNPRYDDIKNFVDVLETQGLYERDDIKNFVGLFDAGRYKCDVDKETKSILISVERLPFTPLNVLKSFIKMAISVMPEDKLCQFKDTFPWLKDPNPIGLIGLSTTISICFRPGPPVYKTPIYHIWEKKEEYRNAYLPNMIFYYAFGSISIQVVLPSSLDAHLQGKRFCIKPLLEKGAIYSPETKLLIQCMILSFHNCEKVENSTDQLSFTYGERIPIKACE